MGLVIPGKHRQQRRGERDSRRACRVSRVTCLGLVREASVGVYVLVHVGFALSCVDREEAERSHKVLDAMGLLQEELGADSESS
jgi:hydrogenase expression/formation protein HypC